mmetsp:Transcript_12706/g.51043  ORF Transcript_12706/g.51043 Transcript_12706/m.51043 type:complete len:248 (-) Transcript_12706:2024-2767(-)
MRESESTTGLPHLLLLLLGESCALRVRCHRTSAVAAPESAPSERRRSHTVWRRTRDAPGVSRDHTGALLDRRRKRRAASTDPRAMASRMTGTVGSGLPRTTWAPSWRCSWAAASSPEAETMTPANRAATRNWIISLPVNRPPFACRLWSIDTTADAAGGARSIADMACSTVSYSKTLAAPQTLVSLDRMTRRIRSLSSMMWISSLSTAGGGASAVAVGTGADASRWSSSSSAIECIEPLVVVAGCSS